MANQVMYGFVNLKDVFNSRVDDVGVEVVDRAIQETLDQHNRDLNAFIDLFADRTTGYKARFKTAQSARLQPLDESGRARPIKPAGYFDVAYPIAMGGTAWGQNFVASKKLTVQDANNYMATLIDADIRWVRDHILAALFASSSYTYTDPDHGSLTIKGLANGDTDKYLFDGGADAMAIDTHYLATASAIADDANPFPTIYSEIMEHPWNAGDVISFIPTGLKSTVEALANFYEYSDPNIRLGANTAELIGTPNVNVPGKLLGRVDKVWVVEWKPLPAGYMINVATDGEKPLQMREDEEAELRGFIQVAERNDHPWYERQYIRRAGFGGYNRVGAVVQLIGNGTYSVPTGYSVPMG